MKHFTKKLALLTLLAGLCGSAWAGEVYWSTNFSSEPTGMTYSVTNGSTDISSGVLSLIQGGGSGNRAINVAFTDKEFTNHNSYSFEFDWGASSSNQNVSTMTLLSDVSSPLLTITWNKWETTASVSDASGNVLTSTLPIDGYSKTTPTKLSHFVINVNSLGAYLTVTNNGTTYVDNIKIGQKGHITGFGGALGRALSYAALDNISLSEFAEADVSTVANYTIKFVDTKGNTIKDDQTDSGTIGESIELDGLYTANFWIDENKYIYVSDNASSITVAENGSSVVIVTFRQASTFSYSVVNNFGETIIDGSVVEGESDIFAYPEYIEVDGTLYKASLRNATNDGFFLYRISPTADGEVLTIDYSEAVTNVVFFAEAEDILGGTPNNESNANIRCSNAYGAYFGNDVTVTTLPAGVYKATVQVWGNTGTTFNINAGENTILEAATVGYLQTYTSEEFTLTKETDIIVPAAGSKGKVIDYVYIVKTGDVEFVDVAVTSAGFATYSNSEVNLDFSNVEGLKAYYVESAPYEGNLVIVEAGKVLAGTAVLLEGAEGTYQVPVCASAETPTTNMLQVADASTVGNGESIFVLANGTKGVGFYVVKDGSSIPAGKAYLVIEKPTDGQTVKSFISLGGDDATAISNVEAAQGTGIIYNLNGQRVAAPVKGGLYIMNGKKMLVK